MVVLFTTNALMSLSYSRSGCSLPRASRSKVSYPGYLSASALFHFHKGRHSFVVL